MRGGETGRKPEAGTTIAQRTLTRPFHERGVKLERTYQLTEEFISRYGVGSAEPSEHRTAAAQD